MTNKKQKKRLTKKQWKRKKRLRFITNIGFMLILMLTLISLFSTPVVSILNTLGFLNTEQITTISGVNITQMYLTPNKYSRPKTSLGRVKGIVVHYTANPGTDALANRNYFENLSIKKTTYASSHFIIGLDGDIIQCLPLNEIAYASNNRNEDTIAIEVCHPNKSGKFTKETYQSLLTLVASLCDQYRIKPKQILRHYDVTGKLCPLYYVEHEDKWNLFKEEVFHKKNP